MRNTIIMAAEPSASAVAAESRFIRRTAEMVRFGWRAYWRWRYRHITLRLLRSMDERLLRGYRGWSLQPAVIPCQTWTAFDQRLRRPRIRYLGPAQRLHRAIGQFGWCTSFALASAHGTCARVLQDPKERRWPPL